LNEKRAILGHYAGSSGNSLPTFRVALFVPSQGVKNSWFINKYRRFGTNYPSHF